jgi:hypothetical protein
LKSESGVVDWFEFTVVSPGETSFSFVVGVNSVADCSLSSSFSFDEEDGVFTFVFCFLALDGPDERIKVGER